MYVFPLLLLRNNRPPTLTNKIQDEEASYLRISPNALNKINFVLFATLLGVTMATIVHFLQQYLEPMTQKSVHFLTGNITWP